MMKKQHSAVHAAVPAVAIAIAIAVATTVFLTACAPPPATETETEEPAPASAVMELPVSTMSDEAQGHYMDGLRAADMGRFIAARGHFEQASAADAGFAMAYMGAALSATSLEAFAENLKLAGENAGNASEAEALFIQSFQQGFDNDLEGQLATAQALAEMHPDSPRAQLRVAGSLAALGRYEEQRATAVHASEVSPGFVPAYVTLGNSYLFNEPRDFAMAEQHMQKIVELEPEEPQSHDLLGDVYRAQSNLEAARDAYTRAADLDPSLGLALQQRGHVNSFLGNWEQARADYDAAIALSDPDTRAGFGVWRALVSVYAGEAEAAVEELNGLVAAVDGMNVPAPRNAKVGALINLGAIATHHGMFEAADAALETCHTLMMEQADEVGTDEFRRGQESTGAYLEGMLAARKGDHEGAAAAAEQFMALLEPDANPRKNEPAHEVLGLSNLLQGNYTDAVSHYEQTNPANIYAKYHLGLAYEGAGDTENAERILGEVAVYNFNNVGFALIRDEVLAKTQ